MAVPDRVLRDAVMSGGMKPRRRGSCHSIFGLISVTPYRVDFIDTFRFNGNGLYPQPLVSGSCKCDTLIDDLDSTFAQCASTTWFGDDGLNKYGPIACPHDDVRLLYRFTLERELLPGFASFLGKEGLTLTFVHIILLQALLDCAHEAHFASEQAWHG